MSERAAAYDVAVGALVRALRLRFRVKQDDLAQRLGLDATTVSRYERGERGMNVSTLLQIADLFGVPGTQLLPEAHRERDAATNGDIVLPDLPTLEAGALRSLIAVLAERPELLIAVMGFIEQQELVDGATQ